MVDNNTFRKMAMQLEGVEEHPHFNKQSFRIRGKNIFATLDEKANRAMLILSEVDQSVFCAFDKEVIYPVPGAWGRQGSTYFELGKIRKTMLADALQASYHYISGKMKKPK